MEPHTLPRGKRLTCGHLTAKGRPVVHLAVGFPHSVIAEFCSTRCRAWRVFIDTTSLR